MPKIMHSFNKYSLQKIVRRLNRYGSALQKRAIKLCDKLDLFAKTSFIEEIVFLGPSLMDLCSWGCKEIEIVYKTSEIDKLRVLNFLDLKYSFLPNYRHTIYKNGDTIINFFYEDWNIILHVTSSEYNFKKIAFTRDYLIDNLSPNDRSYIVSMCRSNVPLGHAIKNAVVNRYGTDHVLVRLSDTQLRDVRYDYLTPVYQFMVISGLVLESYWNLEKQNWMLKKDTQ